MSLSVPKDVIVMIVDLNKMQNTFLESARKHLKYLRRESSGGRAGTGGWGAGRLECIHIDSSFV